MRKLSKVRSQLSTAVGRGRGIDAQGASIPVPTEGWDAISPLAAMSPKRAVKLINWFPQPSWIELRKGHIRHCDTGTGEPVETVMAYQGVSAQKLFAASDLSIFNVTDATATADVTGLANNRFQYLNFATSGGNFLYAVNGVDDPQFYDGTSWDVAAVTGVSNIIGVNAHKNRLWFVEDQSSDAWYLDTDAIQGSASAFPLGGLFTQGGYLMAMGTWSIDAGQGPDDYAIFISSQGQVAIYSGTDPADADTWKEVGVFNMGPPIGRRCLTKVGADIAIICIDGVVPLSRAMIFERAAVQKVSLTQNIQRVMNQSARDYRANFGWQLISYPKGTRAILNVPVQENASQEQYVMNTLNGAWCRFTGMEANCWETLTDDLFFGGNDGVVYQADTSGTDANGAIIRADMETAFNYFGARGRLKRWMMCRPLLTTDQQVDPGLAFNVDFQQNAPISVPATPAVNEALWDVALWDDSVWAGDITTEVTWTSVTGLGYCASIRMVVDIEHANQGQSAIWGAGVWGVNRWGADVDGREITLQVNGFDLVLEQGAFV